MAGKDFSITQGGMTIKVEGLRDTLRSMEKSGTKAEDLKDLMANISNIVIQAANPPVASGVLSGSIRPGRAKSKAVIRAGSARVPYAGVIQYGWPGRNIRPQPFLTDALAESQAKIFEALDKELQSLLKSENLT